MKTKQFMFDVELIIDYRREENVRGKPYISTHRMYRGLTLKELKNLIQENNNAPIECEIRTTFNIRGVDY